MVSFPTWLFVAYGGGHAKALLPVARRVQAQGLAKVQFLALTTAAAEVRAAGLPTVGFADLLRHGDEAARRQGEILADGLAVQAAAREESVAYLGLSYQALADELGADEAARRYARFGRQCFLPVTVLERALARWQPSLVLATNSPRAERAALLAARRTGIPSLCLVDLFGVWERDWLALPDYADAVCVLNEAVRAALLLAGRPAHQVHVTGNPAFDGIADPAWQAQGAQLRREAGWDGLRVLLYASSPEPRHVAGVDGEGDETWPRRVEEALIAAVQADPSLALWVRRHPSEPPATGLAHPRIRVAAGPLHAFLQASDEVLVTVSTVGIEAWLAGRPVTQVRGSILDGLSPYLAMGIAQRELRLVEIAAGLRHAPAAPAAAPWSQQASAAARVLEVALGLVRGGQGAAP